MSGALLTFPHALSWRVDLLNTWATLHFFFTKHLNLQNVVRKTAGRIWRRWEDNIKMNFRETGCSSSQRNNSMGQSLSR
jgi:hypothetical protein